MKKPLYTPKEGESVKLKGREATGVIKKIAQRNWVWVDWEASKEGPQICHLYELEKINDTKRK